MKSPWSRRWPRRSVLGLAITPGAVLCAQVHRRAGRSVVQRLARWELPAGGWDADPAMLGRELRTFLSSHGFTATRAAIGLPARWLVSHLHDLPPCDSNKALAMLRLAAERLSSSEQTNLIFDVAGEPGDREASKALLVGMLRSRRDALSALALAAGLEVEVITATALALAPQFNWDSGRMVMLMDRGAELVAGSPRRPLWLGHVGLPAGDAATEAAHREIRRAVAMLPPSATVVQRLLRIAGTGWTQTQADRLADQFGVAVSVSSGLSLMSVDTDPAAMNGDGQATADSLAPAVALALAALESNPLALNLGNPRLTAPVSPRVPRQTALAIAAGIAIVLGLSSLYLTVVQREAQVAEAQAKLAELQPQLAAAQDAIRRVNVGRGYFRDRPAVLDALRQITMAIPIEDPLWVRSITQREGMLINVQGTAGNQKVVLALLDRLRDDAAMADVRLLDMHDEGRGGATQISFSIDLRYIGTEGGR